MAEADVIELLTEMLCLTCFINRVTSVQSVALAASWHLSNMVLTVISSEAFCFSRMASAIAVATSISPSRICCDATRKAASDQYLLSGYC